MKEMFKHQIEYRNPNDIIIHKITAHNPEMNPEGFNALVYDMKMNGWQDDSYVLMFGRVDRGKGEQAVSGRHRISAAVLAGIETIPVKVFKPTISAQEMKEYIYNEESNRRHQSPTQKAITVFNEWLELQGSATPIHKATIAKIRGVNKDLLSKCSTILATKNGKDVLEILFKGEMVKIGTTNSNSLSAISIALTVKNDLDDNADESEVIEAAITTAKRNIQKLKISSTPLALIETKKMLDTLIEKQYPDVYIGSGKTSDEHVADGINRLEQHLDNSTKDMRDKIKNKVRTANNIVNPEDNSQIIHLTYSSGEEVQDA